MLTGGWVTLQDIIKILRKGLILLTIILFAVFLRLSYFSYYHYREAVIAQQKGDLLSALNSYSWSIRNYFPANPYAYRSVNNSISLMQDSLSAQQSENVQHGLHNLRAALYSIRTFYQPYSDSLRQIEEMLNQKDEDLD
ncbi:MAG: hypothetical protein ACOX5R_21550 [bacterium]|jgi:hypothetical protein